jgi:hypothetical protein
MTVRSFFSLKEPNLLKKITMKKNNTNINIT